MIKSQYFVTACCCYRVNDTSMLVIKRLLMEMLGCDFIIYEETHNEF